jgi:hypothetical protein
MRENNNGTQTVDEYISLRVRVGQVARRHASRHTSLTGSWFKAPGGHGQPNRPSFGVSKSAAVGIRWVIAVEDCEVVQLCDCWREAHAADRWRKLPHVGSVILRTDDLLIKAPNKCSLILRPISAENLEASGTWSICSNCHAMVDSPRQFEDSGLVDHAGS